MTVPDYQLLMKPVLDVLLTGERKHIREIVSLVSDVLELTEEDRAATIPSGTPLISNRVAWSLSYLARARVIARPMRGMYEITSRGRELLAENLTIITNEELSRYPEFDILAERSNRRSALPKTTTGSTERMAVIREKESPLELIDRAVMRSRTLLEAELLERVLELDPTTFERLVVRLLQAMGYGETGRVEHTGKSGDGGIDGMVSQDPLGLDRVYMQAKRYARDNVIGRPAIQGFVGALHGFQADRGVFITTSSFSKDASGYADAVNARLILIDGDRLASLMIRYGVGVQADYVATLHRVDEDFFDTI